MEKVAEAVFAPAVVPRLPIQAPSSGCTSRHGRMERRRSAGRPSAASWRRKRGVGHGYGCQPEGRTVRASRSSSPAPRLSPLPACTGGDGRLRHGRSQSGSPGGRRRQRPEGLGDNSNRQRGHEAGAALRGGGLRGRAFSTYRATPYRERLQSLRQCGLCGDIDAVSVSARRLANGWRGGSRCRWWTLPPWRSQRAAHDPRLPARCQPRAWPRPLAGSWMRVGKERRCSAMRHAGGGPRPRRSHSPACGTSPPALTGGGAVGRGRDQRHRSPPRLAQRSSWRRVAADTAKVLAHPPQVPAGHAQLPTGVPPNTSCRTCWPAHSPRPPSTWQLVCGPRRHGASASALTEASPPRRREAGDTPGLRKSCSSTQVPWGRPTPSASAGSRRDS